jgi:CubicO group peptidase (beta-lactamase class C family)
MTAFRRAAIACSFWAASCSARTPAPDASEPSGLAAIAPAGFSGVILAEEGGDVFFAEAYGMADPASGRAMTLDDSWRWASFTKLVVATLVMQEVEQGRIALDAAVSQWLPDYPGAENITVRQLLTHRSGVADADATPIDAKGAPGFFSRDPSVRAQFRNACDGPARAAPGAGFHYNNCDYIILSRVLGAVAGKPWTALFKERIAAPAGMRNVAAIGVGGVETVRDIRGGKAGDVRLDVAGYGAAGALAGPPAELLKFNAALRDGRLLRPESFATLMASRAEENYVALGAWSFESPLKGCGAPVRLIERRGDIDAVEMRSIIAPDFKRSVVVFSNKDTADFGEIWMQQGFAFELASAAFCFEKS